MKKTLILHIGQTKTATTSLQTFFADNRPALAAQGVLYPEVPADHEAKHQHRFLVESLYGPPGAAEAAWDYLLETIAGSALPRVLISEEVFWHLHEAQPARRRSALEWVRRRLEGFELRIVCYLRRQDLWVQSWHNQIAKTDVSEPSRFGLGEFVDAQLRLGMLDYARILEDWLAVFGRERLLVREFASPLMLRADPVADFMHHALGLDDLSEFLPVGAHQRSLAQAALTAAVRFNRTASAERFKSAHQQMLRNANPLLEDRQPRLTTAQAALVHGACRDSNQRLAAALGWSNGGLFQDWVAPGTSRETAAHEATGPAAAASAGAGAPASAAVEEHWQARIDLAQGDALALMAQMFQRFEDRFSRMQKRIDALEAQLRPPEAAAE